MKKKDIDMINEALKLHKPDESKDVKRYAELREEKNMTESIDILVEELARERSIGVLEYVRTRAITGNDGTWHIETDYGFSQSLTNAELYDLYLSQLKEKL